MEDFDAMAEEPLFDLLDDIDRLTRPVRSQDRSHGVVHPIDNGQFYDSWNPSKGASGAARQLQVADASDEPQRMFLQKGWFLNVLSCISFLTAAA
jgi:hypothetical protein